MFTCSTSFPVCHFELMYCNILLISSEILSSGGSVVDSAIATLLCIGVHCAQSTGIGGGSAMLIYAA